jgi:hypothetical protein
MLSSLINKPLLIPRKYCNHYACLTWNHCNLLQVVSLILVIILIITMALEYDDILQHRGGMLNNDLTKKLNLNHFEISAKMKSKYYDTLGFSQFLLKHSNKLTILSLNIASLHSKHNDLKQLVDELAHLKVSLSIICIQEAGIKDNTDTSHLELDNYTLITQSLNKNCCTKGGLAIYILNTFEIKNIKNYNTFSTWEGLSIDITGLNNRTIRLLNIYRPGRNNNNHAYIDRILEDFKRTIKETAKSTKNLIVTGDFNIDLLKINTNEKFQEFYDILTDLNLIPVITFPTRASKNKPPS